MPSVTTSDGLRIAADILADDGRPVVILLHGGGQTRHAWANAMRRLVGAGYGVVNYDARGHGESDWSPAGDYSIAAFADDLRAVRAGFGPRVALVGASMGGMTAFYALGSSDGPFADALVMVDIALRPTMAGGERIRAFMRAHPNGFATIDEAADAVAAYNPERPRPQNADGLRRNLRLHADGRLHWHWDPRFLEAASVREPPLLIAVSDRVTVPTLLVRGAHSDVVDDAVVAEMRRHVPQTEICEVANAGHMVAGDRNDAFTDCVLPFLTRHFPLT